jgi:TonB family protein
LAFSQKVEEVIIPIDRSEINSKPDSSAVYNFAVIEEKPEFPGGNAALMQFLGSNTKYPEYAKENGIQGRVFVAFVIDKDGKVIDVEILRGVHKILDKEAIRVVSSMPDWSPGIQKGKAVKVRYQVPINFKLFDNPSKESKPQFPGGEKALLDYIRDNTIYPASIYEKGIKGHIIIGFVIDTTGAVGNVELLKGIHKLLDEEALRVVTQMPNWSPGYQKGKPVKVRYQVPIMFDHNTKRVSLK